MSLPTVDAATPNVVGVETPAGRVTVSVDDIVTFPHGVPGFEACRRYVVVAPPETAPFAWLQGLDSPEPAFLAVDPRLVAPDYPVTLSVAERARLGAEEPDRCLWLAIVRVQGDRLSANLAAPIVINPARMLGLQALPADARYGTDHAIGLAA